MVDILQRVGGSFYVDPGNVIKGFSALRAKTTFLPALRALACREPRASERVQRSSVPALALAGTWKVRSRSGRAMIQYNSFDRYGSGGSYVSADFQQPAPPESRIPTNSFKLTHPESCAFSVDDRNSQRVLAPRSPGLKVVRQGSQ
jgi:hypothetical protein